MADRQGEPAPGQTGFDPRFPARFQPGYDATQDAGGRPDSEVQVPEASSQATRGEAVRDQAAQGRASQGPARIAAPEPTPPRAEARHSAASAAAPQAEQEPGITVLDFTPGVSVTGHSTPPATRRIRRSWWRHINPYLVVLTLLGVGFIVGASEWARIFVAGPGGFDEPLNETWMAFLQFAILGVPLLFVLGLATLTAVVAILALRWPRHPRNAETPPPSAAPSAP